MDGQQKDLVSVLIITAGDILAFILQNPLKFVPVNSLHTSAVYMFASAVLCIESEVCKSADFCILRQLLPQFLMIRFIRSDQPDDPFRL